MSRLNPKTSPLTNSPHPPHYVFHQTSWLRDPAHFPETLYSDYVINPRDLCPRDVTLDYVIVVHSAVDHFERRRAIRETFGAKNITAPLTSRLVFLLGLTPDAGISTHIQNEAEAHGDVIQGDFLDTYHNLTLKGVMGLRWLTEYCPKVTTVVKIDDDVFLNIFRLTSFIFRKLDDKKHAIACALYRSGESAILRSEEEKWKVDENEFPGLTHYPLDHCQGFLVLLTSEVIKPLYEASKVVPFFWIDDIYLFGLLPLVVGDVTFIPLLDFTRKVKYGRYCFQRNKVKCSFTAVYNNQFDEVRMRQMWGLRRDKKETLL